MSTEDYASADIFETAVAMGSLYAEINPDLGPEMKTEVIYWLDKSIRGEAHGMWETYARDMIR